MVRIVHQRTMKGNQIALSKQLFKTYICHKVFQFRIFIDVISNDLHTKSPADFCHGSSDLTCTYNTRRLLEKVKAHQTTEAEIILPYFYIRFMKPAVYTKRKRHSMFRYCLRRITRYTQHTDSIFFRCVQIHIVESGTAH